jgi:hypothetical protein
MFYEGHAVAELEMITMKVMIIIKKHTSITINMT